jgi:hypothetical protein
MRACTNPPYRTLENPARVFLLIFALAAMACGDDPFRPNVDGFGQVSGKWNGKVWSGLGYAVIRHDSLLLVGHWPDPKHYYDEYVVVSTPFVGPATYLVDAAQGSLSSVVGGDAGYFVSASGSMTVTRYDSESRTLEGTVSLTSSSATLPWTFEQGSFNVPVYGDGADVPATPCRPAIRCTPGE